jgi:ABC-type polysaccharide/polyol phosphate export permease
VTETTMAPATSRRPLRAQGQLIWTFAIRDLRARFTATRLGLAWALIVPMTTVLIYTAVFSVIFRAPVPPLGNGQAGLFPVWFFCALVPWNIFSQALNASLVSIVSMGAMLQKVYIPSFVPVLAATMTISVEKLLEVVVLMATLLVVGNIAWTWLLFPLLFVGIAVLAASLGYLLAIANVHFRDTGQIFAVVLQMWFFLTPIMYPLGMIPEHWRGFPLRDFMNANPMTQAVTIARDLLYDLRLPSVGSACYFLACACASVLAAWVVHRRWGRDVAEAI